MSYMRCLSNQVREELLALPGGLSEARPVAELRRRMAEIQAQVTAQPVTFRPVKT